MILNFLGAAGKGILCGLIGVAVLDFIIKPLTRKVRFECTPLKTSFKIAVAALPYLTIGMIGEKTGMCCSSAVLWVSGAVGLAGLLGMLWFLIKPLKSDTAGKSKIQKVINDLLGLPNAFALSSLILIMWNIDASSGLWLALALGVLIVISDIIIKREKV